jgi:putative addiction module killer protein
LDIFDWSVEDYVTSDGKDPFEEWINSLKDKKTKEIIYARLDRLESGNFGLCRHVGNGVHELRIFFGPGYRVYFGTHKRKIVLILTGGDKSSQTRDIQKAKQYWEDYQRRMQ